MNILNIVSFVCFAVCLLMFLYLRWDIKKRISASSLIAGELNEHKAEVIKLIADINEVTDRDFLLIEDRVNKLKTLLNEVDRRIALYEKDIESISAKQIKPDETLYTSLGRGIRSALTSANTEPPSFETAVSNLPSASLPPRTAAAAPRAPLMPPALLPETDAKPAPAPLKPPSKKQIRAHIDMLANEGLMPEEIAKHLEISVAEVNLAMNLRRK